MLTWLALDNVFNSLAVESEKENIMVKDFIIYYILKLRVTIANMIIETVSDFTSLVFIAHIWAMNVQMFRCTDFFFM